MRRHTFNTAVTLCAAALLTTAMGTAAFGTASAAPQTAPAVKQQSVRPVLVDCFWNADVRPDDFMLACGDGNSRLSSLDWSQWDPNSATATGINVVNDCKPYCAAGTFHSYPVIVRLEDPQPWAKHPQLQHYTEMELIYVNDKPDGFPQVLSLPLWD
ncbi:hypothetical protein [Streptomyces sp. GC420]|uniref:hypothetical protein n=1 Tax=Streptomyces sp. GC420 TaxID=2697568 RepID=UPI0014152FF8|nr:hypothetical protein [Streptomyces sp. GC420]NBM16713.1 hypothetical protein [Streptomyces sp. GC420]